MTSTIDEFYIVSLSHTKFNNTPVARKNNEFENNSYILYKYICRKQARRKSSYASLLVMENTQ